MNQGHQRFQDWLIAGAEGDPPRDLAVHASVCTACQQSIAALDRLALVNTGWASMPGAPTGRERSPLVMAGRLTAAAAVMFSAAALGVGVSQLIGVSRPGGPVAQASPSANQGVLGATATPQPSPSAEGTASVAQQTLTPLGTPLPTHRPAVTPVPARTPAPTSPPTGTPIPTPISTPTPVPTPAPTAPSAPLSPLAVSGTSGNIELTWQPPASDGGNQVIGYNVYRSDTASGAETFYVGGLNVTYLDDSGTPGTVVYYVVTALNNVGESVWSAETSVTVAN